MSRDYSDNMYRDKQRQAIFYKVTAGCRVSGMDNVICTHACTYVYIYVCVCVCVCVRVQQEKGEMNRYINIQTDRHTNRQKDRPKDR